MTHVKQRECYTLTDLTTEEVKTVVEDLDLCQRFLKHSLPDGSYNISGPNVNLDLFRHHGVVYPAGGVLGNTHFPRRSLEECQEVFAGADFGWPMRFSDN